MTKHINTATLDFLVQLTSNNNREWFNENKALYQAAQKNFTEVVDDVIKAIAEFDESVEKLEAKSCVFRIYKDTRFSKDKTPYKINLGASLSEKGTKTLSNAGYYIHLEPGKSFIAGGVYMTDSPKLKSIRTRISEESDAFFKMIHHKNFKSLLELRGEKLMRVPQGFNKEDKMADYLKYKQFTVFHELSDDDILSPNLVAHLADIFKEIYPFNQFLNEAIDNF